MVVTRSVGCDIGHRGGVLGLYEDLAARALGAQERARSLGIDAGRVTELSRALREARAGGALLLHCAWCGKLQVGDEWLRLDAIGSGQTRIAEQLGRQSTHGICPDCFDRVSDEAKVERLP
jgi:hypothetical protein